MKGRRVEDDHEPNDPGDYSKLRYRDGAIVWTAITPNGHRFAFNERHRIEEHADRTITVTPSILVHERDSRGELTGQTAYHGFLERGEWRDA